MSAILSKFRSALLGTLFLVIPFSGYAQRVTATVPVGAAPAAIAVNQATNRTYVANTNSNTVTVIDGSNNSSVSLDLGPGNGPRAIALNPVTNKIYVANGLSGTVTVIDGATNVRTPVNVGTTPAAIAVNPITNKIYVANLGSGTVTVIDGLTNTTTPVNVATAPRSVAVNPVTNKIYVSSQNTNNVSVINGTDNTVTYVNNIGVAGATSFGVAVNPVTNKIYVTSQGPGPSPGQVIVINGADNTFASVNVGSTPVEVAINPVTNMAYVANAGSNSVTAIDGSNNKTSISTNANPMAVAVNSVTNKIYATSPSNNQITVIDGASNTTTVLNSGAGPAAIAVDPVTNRTYVVNRNSNNVTVVDGATNTTASVATDTGPVAVAVNQATNKIYVANYAANDITVIDGATNATVNVPDPNGPISIDVNPVTNKIWVANQNSTVTVIDGATNATASVNVIAPGNVSVNPVTNKIYVVSSFGAVTVIDGATNATVQVNGGNTPVGNAVNSVTNKIYVADCPCDPTPPLSSTLTIIDGATNAVTSVPVGLPQAIAINPVTNKIYLTNTNNTMTVVDGFTYATTTVFAFNPGPIAVNPITNRIYVGNSGGGSSAVTVFDGATNNFVLVPVGANPQAVAVNPVTNKIYVVSANNTVTVIDGTSNSTSLLTTDIGPQTLAVDPVTGKIYVANNGGNDATVITEQQVNAIPLTTTITPLPGNQTTTTQPTFMFTTNSSYAPTAPPVQTVYYQVDTWQGPWLQASGPAPTFMGQTPVLRLGTHVLYAYAADGQTADSMQTGALSSPTIGQIAAYVFTVMPSASYAAGTLSSSANPSSFNQSVTFTATVVSSTGTTPTGTVAFMDGNNLLGSGMLSGSGVATFTISTLTPGTHPITAVYSGDSSFLPSLSNAVYQVVRRDPTITTVALTTGTNPSVAGTSLTFTATVTPAFSGIGVPSGMVQFRDNGAPLGAACTLVGGSCSITTAALAPGVHAITASYLLGDAIFAPSVSPVFTQVVESNAGGASTATLMVNGSAGPVTVNFGVALGTLPAQRANFVVTVTGGANGDMVVLMDGNRQLGPTLSLAAGTASYAAQLPVGQHNVQAVYIGSGAAHGSMSLVVAVDRSPRPRPR